MNPPYLENIVRYSYFQRIFIEAKTGMRITISNVLGHGNACSNVHNN